eukprot:gene37003-49929_t
MRCSRPRSSCSCSISGSRLPPPCSSIGWSQRWSPRRSWWRQTCCSPAGCRVRLPPDNAVQPAIAGQVASVLARLTAERRFYSSMALFMIVVVVIGFAPSFYLRGIVHSPRPNPSLPPAVMFHGLMFSLWMIIFWAQAALVAAGQRTTHMRLGVAGMIFAALL